MSNPNEASQPENTYFIDPKAGAEAARLIDQDRMITENMGGVFPTHHIDLSSIQQVLDVACGPGGWAQKVALTHPKIQVTGIDINHPMIAYAQAFAHIHHLSNIQFRVMNALEPLAFADATFDFVNARFLVGFLSRTSWPSLVQELVRVTHPGGTIRFTEADDGGVTTSPAFERIKALLAQAFYQTGRSFEPLHPHFGVTARLAGFLREAGVQKIQEQTHHLDFSFGAPAYVSNFDNYRIGYRLLHPFLINAGVTTQDEIQMLYDQMIEEMLSPTFQGLCTYLSVWGQKPEATLSQAVRPNP